MAERGFGTGGEASGWVKAKGYRKEATGWKLALTFVSVCSAVVAVEGVRQGRVTGEQFTIVFMSDIF